LKVSKLSNTPARIVQCVILKTRVFKLCTAFSRCGAKKTRKLAQQLAICFNKRRRAFENSGDDAREPSFAVDLRRPKAPMLATAGALPRSLSDFGGAPQIPAPCRIEKNSELRYVNRCRVS
jgi:hypothetical protein